MQPERAIRQMRHAEILRRGQEVQRLARQQRRHRNLKRLGHAHTPALVRATRVNIHHVESHPDRIAEPLRARALLNGLPEQTVIAFMVGSPEFFNEG